MKRMLYIAAVALAAFGLASCEKDNDGPGSFEKLPGAQNVYFLSQGSMYNNIEGGLTVVDLGGKKAYPNVFKAANGRSLGDTPQCAVAYGSKIYAGTSQSNTIEIMDVATYKSYKQIKLANEETDGKSPYSMVAYDGKVYISMFDGYLARLDTLTMTIDKSVAVGPNPDQIALHDGKIFVPVSDGMNYPNYGTTACVVDPKTMQKEKTFTVPLNPSQFISANGHLYLLCKGNYEDVPSIMCEVTYDSKKGDYVAKKVCDATIIAPYGDKVAVVNEPYTQGEPVVEYKLVDTASGKISDWKIERPDYASNIFYDSRHGKLFITSYVLDGGYPSYVLPGYVNCYEKDSDKVSGKYNLGAAGPTCIFTLQK